MLGFQSIRTCTSESLSPVFPRPFSLSSLTKVYNKQSTHLQRIGI